ncbi:sucrase/ferredoxin domain-containing protein [Paracoccidioides lutzii Pb01]|uniref:Sucrase/ferredoxin domain-containing protein n=1 Tax=Paracoccidioides lutzii (strain ATCC MYA-826 / Pb01) TaxID=502779 RepID=C1GWU3_PARBA|nr:sucrase/ferredoxin domain-containing protein [Paracoccidioides lutzii Pb01]EEH41031.1 sucrase/ferredoxin domain-containing protein [Paracoccidioides lutzii Pb01]
MLRSLLFFRKQNPTKSGSENCSIESNIFPVVNPAIDGLDCNQDCADCTIKYPSRFKINTDRELYGSIKPFVKHVLVATGKADWAEKVENEQGSVMEGFKNGSFKPRTGPMMVSASNMSIDPERKNVAGQENATTVLVLPSFTFVDSVTVSKIPEFMDRFIDSPEAEVHHLSMTDAETNSQTPHPQQLTTRPCLRDHIILLCSHNRRDARCGISAPLIRRELERHLRHLCLYRDEDDTRPGGVSIIFVSHVGGHKFAANVLIYRRKEEQMIWLARVAPKDCEGIVKYTVLQGKVVHPEQLRGGFDQLVGREVR